MGGTFSISLIVVVFFSKILFKKSVLFLKKILNKL